MVEWNNGTTTQKFAYIHNLQGDIVGILDDAGTEVVKYTYDAWGKPLFTTGTLANTLGKLNPFRYRGYVFDEETRLYYLRSRYYCPHQARFINADIVYSSNLYSYCTNSPINQEDPSGYLSRFLMKEFGQQLEENPNHALWKYVEHMDAYGMGKGMSLIDGQFVRSPDSVTYTTKEHTHIDNMFEYIIWHIVDACNILYQDISDVLTPIFPVGGTIVGGILGIGSYIYQTQASMPYTHKYTEHTITYKWNGGLFPLRNYQSKNMGFISEFTITQTFFTSNDPSCDHFQGVLVTFHWLGLKNNGTTLNLKKEAIFP